MVSAIGLLTIAPLFRLMGAPEEMIPLISGYMRNSLCRRSVRCGRHGWHE